MELTQVASDIEMEEQRVQQWKVENVRRRHNYVPFIVNFLRVLAERGELMSLVDQAKKKQKQGRG
jgi:ubiquitin carboxyl-terminal hydrolase L5